MPRESGGLKNTPTVIKEKKAPNIYISGDDSIEP